MAYHTEQRSKLRDFFQTHPHEQFSAKDIAGALQENTISISAIYRNLASLTQDGTIRRSVRHDGRETVYQYVAGSCCQGQIHLTCTGCGKIFHMNHLLNQTIRDDLAKLDQFQIDTTKTVLYGTCKACMKK